jgi:TonB family protein
MNGFLEHMMKSSLYIAALYIVYSAFLSRDTYYGRNRAFITISLIISLLIPLITFQTSRPLNIQIFGKLLSEVFITPGQASSGGNTEGISGFMQKAYTIYITIALILTAKLLVDFLNLLFLIVRKKEKGSRIIRFHGFNTAGFTAMGYIFISSRLTGEESDEIIKHELNHLMKNHFIDILLLEIIKAFQWFNPAVYLFDRSMRAIHEYQADHDCIRSGVPVLQYQNLLLSQVFKSNIFNLTNSFSNPSLLKKRMVMMTKKRTSAISSIKLLIAFPVLGVVFLVISSCRENADNQKATNNTVEVNNISSNLTGTETMPPPPPPPPPPVTSEGTNGETSAEAGNTPYTDVDEMPVYPGGDQALLKYIGNNTIYPDKAKNENIQGRVIVRFCVNENGTINRVSTLKGVSPELDAEAVRVVKTLPAFKPGKKGGIAVPVWYMVPITFTLK